MDNSRITELVRAELARRELARRSFIDYIHYINPSYQMMWFHRLVAEKLEEVRLGKIKKLAIFLTFQHGKALVVNELCLTTQGWKRHGDLQAGDFVFGQDGKPTRVIANSGKYEWPVLRVVFEGGVEIEAAMEHEWQVCINGAFFNLETQDLIGIKDPVFVEKTWKGDYTRMFIKEIIDEGKIRSVNCIQVEGGMYLAGPHMIPTHNSELCSRMFPSFMIGHHHHDDLKIAICSYAADLSEAMNKDVQSIIEREEYAQLFDTVRMPNKGERASRSGAKVDFMVRSDHRYNWKKSKGYILATGVRGGLTGKTVDLVIIDDPVKDKEEVESPTTRDKVWDWYMAVVNSRLHNDSAQIMIQCMVGDTPVLMADGSKKELKDIKVGDIVATYDNGNISASKVTNWANKGADCVFEIRTKGGRSVKANERHPFLIDTNGFRQWRRLKYLKPGDEIVRVLNDNETTLDVIVEIVPAGCEDVYDIEVERTENFIANDLVSHNTRWHEDDLSGRLLSKQGVYSEANPGGWHVISLPGIRTNDVNDYDPRKPGEVLWPERHSYERLMMFKRDNPMTFNALVQQDPKPNEETIIYGDWIEIDEFPHEDNLDAVFYGLDFGFTNDPTALVKIGRSGNRMYLDEIIYEKGLGAYDIRKKMMALGVSRYREIYADHDPAMVKDLKDPKGDDGMPLVGEAFNILPAVKPILDGISTVKEYKIYYTKRSLNIKMEKNKYAWRYVNGKNTNEPIDNWNHCFTGDTMISTIEGDKRIDEVKVGDYVLTSSDYRRVDTFFSNGEKDVWWVLLTFKLKHLWLDVEMKVTPDHKFKTTSGWKPLKELTSGDVLFTNSPFFKENHEKYTKKITLKEIRIMGEFSENVYDIEVNGMHEYFANGVLVHNCMDAIRYGIHSKYQRRGRDYMPAIVYR